MISFALNANGALFLMASTAFAHEYKLGTPMLGKLLRMRRWPVAT
jgi:hypothetical protein